MIDQRLRAKGAELTDRVRAEVDAASSLDRLVGRRRRTSLALAGVAAIVVIGALVGAAWLVRAPVRPIGDVPVDATGLADPPLRTFLPVTVSLALLDGFEVDAGGICTGSGVAVGSRVDVAGDQGVVIESVAISEPGSLIDGTRVSALGLPPVEAGCLFEVVKTTSLDIANLGRSSLHIDGRAWPPERGTEAGSAVAGQQLTFYILGGTP